MQATPINMRIKATKPENVRATIELLGRVKERGSRLMMRRWQESIIDPEKLALRRDSSIIGLVTNEEDAHNCGSACCFAGWVAVSKHFQDFGGGMCPVSGGPILAYHHKEYAIAEYFGIPVEHAGKLTAYTDFANTWQTFYEVNDHDDITIDMVIQRLQELL